MLLNFPKIANQIIMLKFPPKHPIGSCYWNFKNSQ